MFLFLKTGAIWMTVKIKMLCLFCNAAWRDIGYGTLTVVGNTEELQIWVALVQNNLNMRKIELWNFGVCVDMYDSISDFTVPVNMDIVHLLSLDAPSSTWSLYILSKDLCNATQNGFQFIKVLEVATAFGEGCRS